MRRSNNIRRNKTCVKKTKNNKTLWTDGIPVEFYKPFFCRHIPVPSSRLKLGSGSGLTFNNTEAR